MAHMMARLQTSYTCSKTNQMNVYHRKTSISTNKSMVFTKKARNFRVQGVILHATTLLLPETLRLT